MAIISLIVSLSLIFILFRFTPRSKYNSNALIFLLAGTLGNGIDRLFKGFVVDIFELIPFHFAIFNIADIAINIAVLFMILEVTNKRKPPQVKIKT